ncbi:Hypothetical Protein FCC1311_039762 [Hondaea fermentalgiana]|uniref:Uncharacterized protein n=1 Tax=Hondaea fermentalgiana TaxID=2315210 RepID=A0A2R5GGH8_9STRA|nr:Hypothetical Protein FCC1311_039762 [Hondaea fermentalgiana]|eukprot:GBG27753.1 Hypothetical Protein FCC1311_039762 [Hondaea fermentalgiana]
MAKLMKRFVVKGSPDEHSTMCALGVVKALVGSMLNIHNYELQRLAVVTCRELCTRLPDAAHATCNLLGESLLQRVIEGNAVQDGLLVREFLHNEEQYAEISRRLYHAGWDLGHTPEEKPNINQAAALSFPDDESEESTSDEESSSDGDASDGDQRQQEPSAYAHAGNKEPGPLTSASERHPEDAREESQVDSDGGDGANEDAQARLEENDEEEIESSVPRLTSNISSFKSRITSTSGFSSFTSRLDRELDDTKANEKREAAALGTVRLPLSKEDLKARTKRLLPFVGLYIPSKKPQPKLINKHAVRFTQKIFSDPGRHGDRLLAQKRTHEDAASNNDNETLHYIKGLSRAPRPDEIPIPSETARGAAKCEVLVDIPLRFLPAANAGKPANKTLEESKLGGGGDGSGHGDGKDFSPLLDASVADMAAEEEEDDFNMQSPLERKMAQRRARAEEIRQRKEELRSEKAAAEKRARLLARQQKANPDHGASTDGSKGIPRFEQHVLLDLAIEREKKRQAALAQAKRDKPRAKTKRNKKRSQA